jgi:hypothetical protein
MLLSRSIICLQRPEQRHIWSAQPERGPNPNSLCMLTSADRPACTCHSSTDRALISSRLGLFIGRRVTGENNAIDPKIWLDLCSDIGETNGAQQRPMISYLLASLVPKRRQKDGLMPKAILTPAHRATSFTPAQESDNMTPPTRSRSFVLLCMS